MSTRVKVTDNLPRFSSESEAAFDRALNNAGVLILRLSKLQVPHNHGALASSGRIERKGKMHFEVQYNTPYALYQERGRRRDGSHVVRHYSKPGKKSQYLKDPGDKITEKSSFERILKSAASSVRL